MNGLRHLIKYNQYSFLFLSFFLVVGIFGFSLFEKGELVLMFNENRTHTLNYVFAILTQFAEPLVCVLFCLLLLFFSWKKGLFLTVGLILNTIVVQFLKHIVFPDFKRPAYALGKQMDVIEGGDLEVIEGMRLSIDYSFPSGHTMAGTTLFFILSLFVESPIKKLLIIALIPLVAISRVYLAQHYFQDILMGSILGVLFSSLYYVIYNQTKFRII